MNTEELEDTPCHLFTGKIHRVKPTRSSAYKKQKHVSNHRPSYFRASSYPLEFGIQNGIQNKFFNAVNVNGFSLEIAERVGKERTMNRLPKQMSYNANQEISQRNRNHTHLKHSASLGSSCPSDRDNHGIDTNVPKWRRGEKRHKSDSSKTSIPEDNQYSYSNLERKGEHNLAYSRSPFHNDTRDELSHKDQIGFTETSSGNSSMKSSRDSSYFTKEVSQSTNSSRASKNTRDCRVDETGRHTRVGSQLQTSPDTNSGEFGKRERRRANSKQNRVRQNFRKDILHDTPKSSYLYPHATLDVKGSKIDKGQGKSFAQGRKITKSNLELFETGNRNGEIRFGEESSRRQGKNCCLLTTLAVVCLVLAAVVTALLVLFLSSEDSTANTGFDMVRAHVRLKIINRDFSESMRNHSHKSFTSLADTFCTQMDYLFLTSSLHSEYFGCYLKDASYGSIHLYYTIPFLDSHQVKNVTAIMDILSGVETNSIIEQTVEENTVAIGDIHIDSSSIDIRLEHYNTLTLPQRPRLPVQGLKSTTMTPTLLTVRELPTRSSVPTPDVTDKSTATPFLTSSAELVQRKPTTSIRDKQLTTRAHVLASTTKSRASITPTPKAIYSTEAIYSTDAYRGTTDNYTEHDPEIEMSSVKVHINQGPATLRCKILDYDFYPGQITIYHKHENHNEHPIYTLINETDTHSIGFQNTKTNLVITHTAENYTLELALKFDIVSCDDTGMYICELISHGIKYSARGYLHGFVMPEKPVLSSLSPLIEGRELEHPVTCSASVGYPPGNLRFEIKPRGHPSFFPIPVGDLTLSGPCNIRRQISLTYTPTKEANGTLLKCIVENNHVRFAHDLSAVMELQVIPGNICEGRQFQKTIRHPFLCTSYITCLGENFEVHECENGVCFDEESGKCGQTALNMEGVVAYLNEGVTLLKCRLTHTGSWNQITILKGEQSGKRTKIMSAINGQEPLVYNSTMKDRVFANVEIKTRYELELYFWVYVLTCYDQGDYFCTAEGPFTVPDAKGYIDIRVKPSAPSVYTPSAIIEGLPTRHNFSCEADVGYPHGELIIKVKLSGDSQFQDLPFHNIYYEEDKNCSKVVRRTFHFLPSLENNGMTIRCEVRNSVTLPPGHNMVSSETIHVVPGNFCENIESTAPRVHPYDCHQYIQCSESYIYVQRCGSDYCYDPQTLRCDATNENSKHIYDPNYPCRPNQNGVFFHHPFLCNKYIWCVQGEEILQHCPIGTLYLDGGQCTFNSDQSRCYKIEEG